MAETKNYIYDLIKISVMSSFFAWLIKTYVLSQKYAVGRRVKFGKQDTSLHLTLQVQVTFQTFTGQPKAVLKMGWGLSNARQVIGF